MALPTMALPTVPLRTGTYKLWLYLLWLSLLYLSLRVRARGQDARDLLSLGVSLGVSLPPTLSPTPIRYVPEERTHEIYDPGRVRGEREHIWTEGVAP